MTAPIFSATGAGPALTPEAYLRACPEAPRGFWSHGERWAVFGGAAARAETPDAGARFRTAAGQLATIFGRIVGAHAPRARAFGGFAFDGRGPADACWQGFPPGLLILPCITVIGEAGGVRLVAHEAGRPEDAAARIEQVAAAARRAGSEADLPAFTRAVPLPARVDGFAAWARAVQAVLGAIGRGEVQKVVLARSLDVRFADPPDPVAILARVRKDNPGGTIFVFEPRVGTVLLGAAPEVLVTLADGRFLTTAVAGSTARGATPAEDEILARRLLSSPKERAEHGFGVDDIVSRLSPYADQVEIESQPRILRLHRIQHLETDIAARVAPEVGALELVRALHPTAAVSGAPREPAASLLAREEALDRGWYAGPVGWCDAAGNGEFAPALRCAVGQGRDWRLFAGAGIVAGSDPDREWSETTMKFAPMLHALGAAGGS